MTSRLDRSVTPTIQKYETYQTNEKPPPIPVLSHQFTLLSFVSFCANKVHLASWVTAHVFHFICPLARILRGMRYDLLILPMIAIPEYQVFQKLPSAPFHGFMGPFLESPTSLKAKVLFFHLLFQKGRGLGRPFNMLKNIVMNL